MKGSAYLSLLPAPRTIEQTDGLCCLAVEETVIVLQTRTPARLLLTARQLKHSLHKDAAVETKVCVGSVEEEAGVVAIKLVLYEQQQTHEQGYRLQITPGVITIVASQPVGIFYGVCTLVQIVQQYGRRLPCMVIEDWPGIPVRGVMLDISRDKVPTMETLFALVDRLAAWKINQFQLYTEHTFAYRAHRDVWIDASPMTGEQILELDAYCRERFIELVPNQNTFGHMKRWLIHPRYHDLAEIHGTFEVPWGTLEGPYSLAPVHPGSLKLIDELLSELLPYFSASQVNIGCDETWDVGQGQSKSAAQEQGTDQVYLDYVLRVRDIVKRHGRVAQFWGGETFVRHPELIEKLPRDMVVLEWGYDEDHPFDQNCRALAEAGIPYYACPGVSSWVSIAGKADVAIENIRRAAEAATTHKADGLLNTDWGDLGHWQPLPVSYLGYVAGAAYSWCIESNRDSNIAELASRYAFEDQTGKMGQLALRLGNLYQLFAPQAYGASHFQAFQLTLEQLTNHERLQPAIFAQAEELIEQVESELAEVRLKGVDAARVMREYQWVIRMMRHADQHVHFANDRGNRALQQRLRNNMQAIMHDYREIWLARNRLGGLEDSMAQMRVVAQNYVE